jgi:hypothetical protein
MSGYEGAWNLAAGLVSEIDPLRFQMLASEAAGLARGSGAFGTPLPWGFVLVLSLATVLAAFLGTYLGGRFTSYARILEHDGWREVTYRFRSIAPLRVTGDVLQRLSEVLGEVEDLGKKIKRSQDAKGPEVMERPPAPVGAAEEKPPLKPVTFARRPAPAPEVDPLERSEGTLPERVREARRSRAPSPAPRATSRSRVEPGGDRAAKIQRARRLLKEGHDPAIVREITGLKLAELDLIAGGEPLLTRNS